MAATLSLSTPRLATTEPAAVRTLLIGGALAYLALFLVLPLVAVFTQAFAKGVGVYLAAITEPAMMLAIFTVAITAGSTNLSQIVLASQGPGWKFLDPAHALAFAAMFIVLLAETGRIPIDNPATHLELTMIHEAMLLEYSGRYLALIEWGASIKQLVLMALLANIFFPVGLAADATPAAFGLGLVFFVAKLIVLGGAVVLVETTNAKLRLFRVPDLLSAAFILATLALVSTFLFR